MLATLGKLKEQLYLSLDDASQDGQLLFCLQAASDAIENHCQRKFKKASYQERRSGTGSKYVSLRNFPIHEISELAGPDGSVTGFIQLGDGILYRAEGWPCGEYNLKLTYIGGYILPSDDPAAEPSDLPATLEMACLILAKMMYKGEWGRTTERIDGEYSVSYAQSQRPTDLPPVVQALCDRHVWRLD